jgi:hypothetical protein
MSNPKFSTAPLPLGGSRTIAYLLSGGRKSLSSSSLSKSRIVQAIQVKVFQSPRENSANAYSACLE